MKTRNLAQLQWIAAKRGKISDMEEDGVNNNLNIYYFVTLGCSLNNPIIL